MVVLVVGGSGGWMIPHSRLAGARAIHRQGCRHPEGDFARKAQFHAHSPSGATGAPWRAPGPSGSGVVVVGGGIKWQQAEDDSAARIGHPRTIHREAFFSRKQNPQERYIPRESCIRARWQPARWMRRAMLWCR